MGHAALDAVVLLAGMAEAGQHPQDVVATAENIAVGRWLDAAGCAAPERLALLGQEVRRWCAVAISHHTPRWERLHRAGHPSRRRKPGAGQSHRIKHTGHRTSVDRRYK